MVFCISLIAVRRGFLVTCISCGAGVGELTFPYVQDGSPAEILARGTLFHLAIPIPLTPHAPQSPGGWREEPTGGFVIALRQDPRSRPLMSQYQDQISQPCALRFVLHVLPAPGFRPAAILVYLWLNVLSPHRLPKILSPATVLP